VSDARTIAVYDAHVAAYVDNIADLAPQDPIINEFIALCPSNGRVLDLGSGPGAYAKIMADAGLYVDAIEASSEMVRHIPPHPKITATVATFDKMSSRSLYDGVWAYFSLLHVFRHSLPHCLTSIYQILKPAGIFFVGMKHGHGHERDTLGRYYEYYDLFELKNLLISAGFSVDRHWSGTSIGLSGQTSKWVVAEACA